MALYMLALDLDSFQVFFPSHQSILPNRAIYLTRIAEDNHESPNTCVEEPVIFHRVLTPFTRGISMLTLIINDSGTTASVPTSQSETEPSQSDVGPSQGQLSVSESQEASVTDSQEASVTSERTTTGAPRDRFPIETMDRRIIEEGRNIKLVTPQNFHMKIKQLVAECIPGSLSGLPEAVADTAWPTVRDDRVPDLTRDPVQRFLEMFRHVNEAFQEADRDNLRERCWVHFDAGHTRFKSTWYRAAAAEVKQQEARAYADLLRRLEEEMSQVRCADANGKELSFPSAELERVNRETRLAAHRVRIMEFYMKELHQSLESGGDKLKRAMKLAFGAKTDDMQYPVPAPRESTGKGVERRNEGVREAETPDPETSSVDSYIRNRPARALTPEPE
ncbi:hypothetical protein F4778DRAFT_85513 [Xylariomycetidae sp. FL2044]|nr:hypothetical protein F4778DRAFT_85513 [Xylariomycetidae sp. FL2044]